MCFQTAITELKANGKGTTEHQPIVSEEDRKINCFRRGAENMRSMTKNTFVVKIDPETNRK